MNEGWFHVQYVILFDEQEQISFTEQYSLAEFLPGYRIGGLWGWDNFMLLDHDGNRFLVPTIPLIPKYIETFAEVIDSSKFELDVKRKGRIKWYVKPIVFSGSPTDDDNMVWITLSDHIDLVKFWNRLYRNITQGP